MARNRIRFVDTTQSVAVVQWMASFCSKGYLIKSSRSKSHNIYRNETFSNCDWCRNWVHGCDGWGNDCR